MTPSIKTLKERLGLSQENAVILKTHLIHWDGRGGHKRVDNVLDIANDMMNGGGVEDIEVEDTVDNYYLSIGLLYVNTGDTYNATLCYDTAKGRFFVGSWGDWVERQRAGYVQ